MPDIAGKGPAVSTATMLLFRCRLMLQAAAEKGRSWSVVSRPQTGPRMGRVKSQYIFTSIRYHMPPPPPPPPRPMMHFIDIVCTTLYRLRREEGSGKTPIHVHGFVLIARASDEIRDGHAPCKFSVFFWLTTNTSMFSHPSNWKSSRFRGGSSFPTNN